MKVTIIGCGWLGFPLAQHWLSEGHQVTGTTSTESKIATFESVGINGFLLQFSPTPSVSLEPILDTDLVVIALPPRAGQMGDDFHVQQVYEIIDSIKKYEKQPKIIYISSTSVYPENNRETTEDDIVIENNALIKVENIIKKAGLRYLILRCGGLMGYERNPAKYVANKTTTQGDVPVNYVHRDDVVLMIDTLLKANIWNEVFNIVAPQHPTRREVYIKAANETGYDLPVFEEPIVPNSFKVISPQKFIKKTGYHYKYDNPLDFFYLHKP
jgi:nucleoside-diphosphate-sugar epimerase